MRIVEVEARRLSISETSPIEILVLQPHPLYFKESPSFAKTHELSVDVSGIVTDGLYCTHAVLAAALDPAIRLAALMLR